MHYWSDAECATIADAWRRLGSLPAAVAEVARVTGVALSTEGAKSALNIRGINAASLGLPSACYRGRGAVTRKPLGNAPAADALMGVFGATRVDAAADYREVCEVTASAPTVAHDLRNAPTANRVGQAIDDTAILREENRQLLAEVTRLRHGSLTEERVRREILKLAEAPSRPPDWLLKTDSERGCYGVPTLFLSDQHLGEVVDPAQCGGVNEYDLETGRKRWRRTIEKSVDLCHNFLARPQFDGIVMALGGDGVSGDIHEELSATNEQETMPTVLDLADLIVWSARELRKAFGRVFVPCVIGNHGRNTKKPRAKGAAFTSFDWLAYQLASRELRADPNVTFAIPSGSDASWRVYGHRYAMTHGSQFRGGDGIIGPLGPVFRGDSKKRARNAQVGQAYDTLLVAHFHQLRMDARLVMNGSMKGYDEYASAGNFPFEPPRQALWLTHPSHGITFSFPVLCEEPAAAAGEPWVSVRAA